MTRKVMSESGLAVIPFPQPLPFFHQPILLVPVVFQNKDDFPVV